MACMADLTGTRSVIAETEIDPGTSGIGQHMAS